MSADITAGIVDSFTSSTAGASPPDDGFISDGKFLPVLRNR